MARINQDLLQAMADRQGLSSRAVYLQITKIVQETFLERELAALVLASRLHMNIHKYSSHDQRNQIRQYLTGTGDNSRAVSPPMPMAAPVRAPARKGKPVKPKKTKGNSVFVVHGRDEALRKSIFEFLRALGLHPMEWSQALAAAKGANPYVGDILDTAMAKVQAVVVLFSPDEVAYLKEQFWGADDKLVDGKPAGQARPNVLFEAGLALGAHPDKTVIVQVGKVRPFSDIAGKHLVKLGNDAAKRNDFASRLAKIGCDVDKVGNDWMTAGKFEPTEPQVKAKKSGRRH
jgi:predicted nucleotide-binding protein